MSGTGLDLVGVLDLLTSASHDVLLRKPIPRPSKSAYPVCFYHIWVLFGGENRSQLQAVWWDLLKGAFQPLS